MEVKISSSVIQQEFEDIEIVGDEFTINRAIAFDENSNDSNALMWVSNSKIDNAYLIKQGIVIVPRRVQKEKLSTGANFILSKNPRLLFSKILMAYFEYKVDFSIAKSAKIDISVNLSRTVFIGENCIIEEGCKIGDNVFIGHNSIIKRNTVIGNNVQIGCNTTIGGVGFGYEKDENSEYILIPHIGNVVIGDNVEIGSNTCIDRGVLGSTIIQKNVKIDNLVHIAHGVNIGENTLVIAHAMIAGSVQIGSNCWIAPCSSIKNGISIGNNVTVGMAANVLKSVDDNTTIVGNPAKLL